MSAPITCELDRWYCTPGGRYPVGRFLGEVADTATPDVILFLTLRGASGVPEQRGTIVGLCYFADRDRVREHRGFLLHVEV